MRADHFQNWRREREAIEHEMDRLIAEGLPTSIEERQVRRMRYAALIERREAAARKLLELARASRHDKSSRGSWLAGDRFISAAPAGAGAESEQAKFAFFPHEKGTVEAAHVTIAASPSDVGALSPGSAMVSAAGDPADVAELRSNVGVLASYIAPNSSTVAAADPASHVERPSTDAVVSAADATATSDDAAVPKGGLPVDAVEPATGVVSHGPDAAAFPIESVCDPRRRPSS